MLLAAAVDVSGTMLFCQEGCRVADGKGNALALAKGCASGGEVVAYEAGKAIERSAVA